ncbi:MAG TPA: chromosome segregation protein SMC [bacterium]|nr:chromosome segregation protein SMC [bacterium]
MYLKKLEIHGFKSFADKTELVFEPGITAVVGPNGCGKTNVSDSVRWVLGEQSAKGLRAGEMTDVIFSGTDTRKPANLAEVTLTLTNEDKALALEFAEISITRRVYRSGEGEYLINKVPARLKDVRELLMGTGLGTSAYSVMEQGKMDKIVTAKPMERRVIFEEAAGITKYKSRKEEALRKLDATEQNLIRVSDIISEIKRQITSLERQAKQAEKYREFKEQLAKLQVQIHLDKAAKLKTRLKDVHHKMNQVKERLEAAQGETHHLEHQEKTQRAHLAQIEQELTALREQAYKVGSEVEVTQGRIEGAQQHKNLLTDQKQRNVQQVAEATSRVEQLKVWVAERLHLLKNRESQKEEKLNRKRELEGKLQVLEGDLSDKAKNLENQNLAAVDLVTQAAQMRAELDSLKSQDEETSRKVSELAANLGRLSRELEEAQGRQARLGEEREKSQEEEAKTGEAILGFQAQLTAVGTQIDEKVSSIQQLNNQVSEARSRYGVLQELQNKLTGYDPGVKSVLQAKQQEPLMWQGVKGVVADLFTVEQAQETAAEALLGGQLQSLVVEKAEDARKVINFLKSEGQGKVSMFVLEDLAKLDFSPIPEKVLTEPGVRQSLKSFLKYGAELSPVIHFLFEQDVLVSEWEAAERLSALYPRVRFVTPDGDRLGPLGFVKAGSQTSDLSLLGRHREMTELSDKLKGLEEGLQRAEGELGEAKKGRKATEDSLIAAETRRQQLKIRLAELEKELSQTVETLGRLASEKAAEEKEKAGLEEHWNFDKERIQELAGLLAKSEQAQHLTQEQIAEARRALQELQSQKEELSKQTLQVDMELAAMEEVAVRAQEEADRYQTEQTQLSEMIVQKAEENTKLDEQNQQLSLALDDLGKKTSGLTQAKQEADAKVDAIVEKRAGVAAEAEGIAEKVRASRGKFEEVQRDLHSFEVQEAQIHVEARNIEEKLQVEYKVDLENPPVALDESFDADEAEKETIELRARIERLGLVNMVAVEEYDELSQRFKFLTEQREDLLKAKDDLQKAIHKINLTSKELFTSTFATVQENFKDIFQRLFEGGRAELILIDEGDVLESGIEIVARPPGKRLQSVSLLSGGEKALTAIALLFALFMVKPSPFCLMDEIDAPLDDVNVSRFTHLLKEFSKRTQFVMVTHNKLSMETGDVIYGVTMQESGVSKIISAKFKENSPEEPAVS